VPLGLITSAYHQENGSSHMLTLMNELHRRDGRYGVVTDPVSPSGYRRCD